MKGRTGRTARKVAISNRHPRLRCSPAQAVRLIAALDAHRDQFLGGCPDGELSIAFLADAELAGIHGQFLRDPTTTDVITFEGEPAFGVAGEICVSADTAETFARAHGRDFSEELALYVVHGWLHLAGYDDLRPDKKRRMRAAEKRAMKILRAEGALPVFKLVGKSPQ